VRRFFVLVGDDLAVLVHPKSVRPVGIDGKVRRRASPRDEPVPVAGRFKERREGRVPGYALEQVRHAAHQCSAPLGPLMDAFGYDGHPGPMPAKTPARKTAATAEGPNPRFSPVAKALSRTAGFSLMESKSGTMRGMMLNGTSFGMSSHGRFILKLTEERAATLIAGGVGKPFSPSAGRVLKGWIEVTDPGADWVALAKEACHLAAEGATSKTNSKPKAGAASRRSASRAPSKGRRLT
jgi:hypothetical protein